MINMGNWLLRKVGREHGRVTVRGTCVIRF